MKKLDYKKLMDKEPTLLDTVMNQLGQEVKFYEHPDEGDMASVIATIEEQAVVTDFFDTEDFYKDSDYNPVMINGKITSAFLVL